MNKLLTFLLLLTSIVSFSQTKNQSSSYFSGKGVEINIRVTDCIKPEKGTEIQYLFIEIVNNNNYDIKVSFDKEMWYNDKCQSCNSNTKEYHSSISIKANQSVSANCEDNNKELSIFSKMLNLSKVRKLTKYELKNITIEKAN
jgi:hypothetical protein